MTDPAIPEMALDPISIASEGLWCGGAPDLIARSTHGHVCFLAFEVVRVPGADTGALAGHRTGLDYDAAELLEIEDEELVVIVMSLIGVLDE